MSFPQTNSLTQVATHHPAVENLSRKSSNQLMKTVAVAAAIALLVIGALGAAGHLNAMTVGATFVGVGAGCPLLQYAFKKCQGDSSADFCKALFSSAIPLGVGISAMQGKVSLRAVSALSLTGSSLYLAGKLCEYCPKGQTSTGARSRYDTLRQPDSFDSIS